MRTVTKPKKLVTTALLLHFAAPASAVVVVVVGFSPIFGGFWAAKPGKKGEKVIFLIPKSLLQLLQIFLNFNKSKKGKGLQVVTSYQKQP